MVDICNSKTDRKGYNLHYDTESNIAWSAEAENLNIFSDRYKMQHLTPFAFGGRHINGNIRGIVVGQLLKYISLMQKRPSDITILDAGSGLGGLSVFLAKEGYKIIGVEISEIACSQANALACKFGVSDNCCFQSENLERTSISDKSIDFIVGLHTLHHFIKYEGVPIEFKRIMKSGGIGLFADGFAENPAFSLFHDKKKMAFLGDVLLNKKLIESYFKDFDLFITPVDWFGMLDKLAIKVCGWEAASLIRPISKTWYLIDRIIPRNRITLFLSGTIMTQIQKNSENRGEL